MVHHLLRSQGDVETAIAVEHAGHGPVLFEVFSISDEHGNLCTVFAGVEHLFHCVVGRVETFDGRFVEYLCDDNWLVTNAV